MCVFSKVIPPLQIAKEDIIVYKEVSNVNVKKYLFGLFKKDYCISDISRYKYIRNKINESLLDEPKIVFTYNYTKGYKSGQGFYSYIKRPIYSFKPVAKFIIPKGAKYYKYGGIYVSNKIIYKGTL